MSQLCYKETFSQRLLQIASSVTLPGQKWHIWLSKKHLAAPFKPAGRRKSYNGCWKQQESLQISPKKGLEFTGWLPLRAHGGEDGWMIGGMVLKNQQNRQKLFQVYVFKQCICSRCSNFLKNLTNLTDQRTSRASF